ncbi:class I SAM-dependent methyltransferase [Limibaculum sp. M0105]|uniref:Class I SAM-dependent methyltransferase n=1 Tax=Thermohalobaculum xanthum TaxID=2753746 RepID=A0A8J7M7Y6_9RHOB|nr:class I SAM-dependent methyltransferase [Thermohalobaculum xanthum]MBK0399333.1 class I SAM-dependent methyltransferase [Thermohalobaculum xanthum]
MEKESAERPEAIGDALYDDPALAAFYDLENGWAEDTRCCLRLAQDAARVLDLGCGTGLLAAAIAERGGEVVGVDRAGAMLDLARARHGGGRVEWIAGDARDLRLGRRFDLVVMTGHAFQVFLTEADMRAACRTIAAHLAPGGRFVFDTRNPGAAEWQEWVPSLSRRTLRHPALGEFDAWNDVDGPSAEGIVTYTTVYRSHVTGHELSAHSRIRFSRRETVAACIGDAGLSVDAWWGDWSGTPWTPAAPEIIPLGGRA